MAARYLHHNGPQARGPFVVVDCTAIPESLFEAELFGHSKGAFTGPSASRQGLVEAADSGTLFLDEIGDLPLSLPVQAAAFCRIGRIPRPRFQSDSALELPDHQRQQQGLASADGGRRVSLRSLFPFGGHRNLGARVA
ncbi:MAG: sigma 54-interacting transcriptional regulator [Burkholderiaceae bacterium]|nr:sigma 54-interacting transcriptional regulator [Burkholderiaceae bacterium]